MAVDITKENFHHEVIASNVPVLAYFHLPNCAKCVVFGSFGEGLEKRYKGKFKLAKFNIMQHQKLARDLGAASAPSFIVLKDGTPIEEFSGERLKKEMIEDFLGKLNTTEEYS